MTDKDPLRHADVGEKKTIETSTEFSFWDGSACKPFLGRDRDHEDIRIKDAEIVGEKGHEQVKITYEGEATKWLHPNWDRQPRKKVNRTSEPRPLWKRIVPHVIALVLTLGVATFVMNSVMGAMNGVTINGEPMTFTTAELIPSVVIVFIIGIIVIFGLNGGLPGMAGKDRL